VAGIGDPHAVALLLLESCAEALNTVPTFDADLLGAPARQFISPGQSVDDCCDQLSVYIPGIAHKSDTRGTGKPHLGAINYVAFTTRITRCIPNGMNPETGMYTPPSATALKASAKQLNADAWALWNHLFNLQSSDLLLNLCSEVFFDGISAIVPSGGCGGWTLQMHVSLEGYPETLST